MQINYYYHGHKFKNIAEMVEPKTNVTWAGKFLISLKDKHRTWDEAIFQDIIQIQSGEKTILSESDE